MTARPVAVPSSRRVQVCKAGDQLSILLCDRVLRLGSYPMASSENSSVEGSPVYSLQPSEGAIWVPGVHFSTRTSL